MKNMNLYKKSFQVALSTVLLSAFVACMNIVSAQSVQTGDLLTFPDGSQGVVCFVDQEENGWVVDLNDMATTYQLYSSSSLPSTPNIPYNSSVNQITMSDWTPEGKSNTEALLQMGSPAAQAVGVNEGWYIPDADQMKKISAMAPFLKIVFEREGVGNIDNIVQSNRNYWTSSKSSSSYFYYWSNRTLNSAYPNGNYYIRRVRNFDKTYSLKVYWESDTTNTTIRVSPDTTTAYKAKIIYNADTFSVLSSVIVTSAYRMDSTQIVKLYTGTAFDTVVKDMTFSISKPGVYTQSDTLLSLVGCDSIIMVRIIIADVDTICESSFATYKYRNTVLPADTNNMGFYEFPGVKVVNGTNVDTISYLKLTVYPEYTSYDTLDVCMYEKTYSKTYSKNSNVTITESTVTSSSTAVVVTNGTKPGDYVLTMQTVNNCDSVINLRVNRYTVPRDTVYGDTLYINSTYVKNLGNHNFTVSGGGVMTHIDTLTAASGCDSIVVITLIVETPHYDTICESAFASYKWRNNTLPADTNDMGFYEFPGVKVMNGTNVDTISYLKLTIYPEFTSYDTLKVCMYASTHRETYSKNSNVTITESTVTSSSSKVVVTNGTKPGDYVLTMQTVNNCDSVINLHVNRYTVPRDTLYCADTILIENVVNEEATLCGHTFTGITAVGSYYVSDTLTAASGCDSIVTVELVVKLGCKMVLSVKAATDEVCGGDGTISLSTTLGDAPILFSIDRGVTWQSDSIFKNVAAGTYRIFALDFKGCTDSVDVTIAPLVVPMITVTCPADIRDTLAYGDCVMNIYPDRIGTPTYIHSFDWPMAISNNIPEDYLFQEGENVITWVFTDKCGNSGSCEQKVTIVFPQCPDAVDCEGNVYKGVRIGCDCWTQRNLESTQYSAGGTCVGDIPCVYEYESSMYPNVAENVATFGKLYCFEAAIGDSSDNGNGHIQGICPEGWYLPTPEKYADLFALGAEALRSPNYWVSGGGNNSTEFTWLPAGMWNGSVNRFEGLMSEGYFWATEDTGSKAKAKVIHISYACDEVMKIESSTGNGYSVRCIKEKGEYNQTTTSCVPTDAQPCPGTYTVLDHEGNKYNTVQIGNQCWTKENMRCKTSPKGYLTEGGGNKSNYIPYYYDYATSPIPFEQRGYLYNWAGAVDTIDTENIIVSFSNRRGICPEGWHVPNDDEWTALEDYLKSQTECYSCSDNRNFIAKALASNEYWLDSSNDCAVGNDLAANNKTGFTLHPAGYNDGSRFFSSNDWAWLATSTSGLGYTAYNRTLLSGAGVVVKAYGGFETIGRSVRCLKD